MLAASGSSPRVQLAGRLSRHALAGTVEMQGAPWHARLGHLKCSLCAARQDCTPVGSVGGAQPRAGRHAGLSARAAGAGAAGAGGHAAGRAGSTAGQATCAQPQSGAAGAAGSRPVAGALAGGRSPLAGRLPALCGTSRLRPAAPRAGCLPGTEPAGPGRSHKARAALQTERCSAGSCLALTCPSAQQRSRAAGALLQPGADRARMRRT